NRPESGRAVLGFSDGTGRQVPAADVGARLAFGPDCEIIRATGRRACQPVARATSRHEHIFRGPIPTRFVSRGGGFVPMRGEPNHNPEELLGLARTGDGPALGQLLELYRGYLKLLVRLQVSRRLQG